MLRRGIQLRILIAFISFSVILGLVYGGLIYGAAHMSEDYILYKRLSFEAEAYLRSWRENPDTPLPATRFMNGYWSKEEIPQIYMPFIEDLEPGLHEINESEMEAHVGIYTPEDAAEPFILVYDVTGLGPMDGLQKEVVLGLLSGVALLTLLGLGLGLATSRRIIAPLSDLASQVSDFEPGNLPTDFSKQFTDDEVGDLARALEETNTRLNQFIDRERQFTANASHELRTPVTVIKGAAELIEGLDSSKTYVRPLQRIGRAVEDMERIIETFLTLARQGSDELPEEALDASEIIQEVVKQCMPLLNGKPVEVSTHFHKALLLQAPEPVIAITAGNIIRNAFLYTNTGQVEITIEDAVFRVRDTGKGIPKNRLEDLGKPLPPEREAEGHGLGLGIVGDFCTRYGWQLHIESTVNEGSVVTIDFKPDA